MAAGGLSASHRRSGRRRTAPRATSRLSRSRIAPRGTSLTPRFCPWRKGRFHELRLSAANVGRRGRLGACLCRGGLAVFPCKANGKPVIRKEDGGNGFKDATTDPDQIRAWWKQWPHAEIGWAVSCKASSSSISTSRMASAGCGIFSIAKASRRKRSKPLSLSRHRAADISFSMIWAIHTQTQPRYWGRGSISAARALATSFCRALATGGNGSSRCRRHSRRRRPGCLRSLRAPSRTGEAVHGRSITRCSRRAEARLSRHRGCPMRRAGGDT